MALHQAVTEKIGTVTKAVVQYRHGKQSLMVRHMTLMPGRLLSTLARGRMRFLSTVAGVRMLRAWHGQLCNSLGAGSSQVQCLQQYSSVQLSTLGMRA